MFWSEPEPKFQHSQYGLDPFKKITNISVAPIGAIFRKIKPNRQNSNHY